MIIGILSRKVNLIPIYLGDLLYSILIYFLFCFLFPTKNRIHILMFSILFCFTIETSQLIQWNSLILIRKTTLGHYVLGEGFLWLDMFCYFVGSTTAYLIDSKFIKN